MKESKVEMVVSDAQDIHFLKVGTVVGQDARGYQLQVGSGRRLQKGEQGKVKTFRPTQLRHFPKDNWVAEPVTYRGLFGPDAWRSKENIRVAYPKHVEEAAQKKAEAAPKPAPKKDNRKPNKKNKSKS